MPIASIVCDPIPFGGQGLSVEANARTKLVPESIGSRTSENKCEKPLRRQNVASALLVSGEIFVVTQTRIDSLIGA
jgi:hypothetical protein